jgi:hypothetical protein
MRGYSNPQKLLQKKLPRVGVDKAAAPEKIKSGAAVQSFRMSKRC